MAFPLFLATDSSQVVNLEPEYGFEYKAKKIQTDLRNQNGGLVQYKWAEYTEFKIPVKFITELEFFYITEWWKGNSNLIFTFQSSGHSVRVINKEAPIDKYVKPYTDLFQGTIELSTY